jgi:hypothetical protein
MTPTASSAYLTIYGHTQGIGDNDFRALVIADAHRIVVVGDTGIADGMRHKAETATIYSHPARTVTRLCTGFSYYALVGPYPFDGDAATAARELDPPMHRDESHDEVPNPFAPSRSADGRGSVLSD